MLSDLVLPHSVNAIGDSAFFMSGILEYTFESIEAPKLETVYRSEIDDAIQGMSTVAYYKGYFYTNFETYIYNFPRASTSVRWCWMPSRRWATSTPPSAR